MNASRGDSIAKSPLALTLSTSGFPGFGSLKCSPGGKATRQVFEVNSKSKLPTWREFDLISGAQETILLLKPAHNLEMIRLPSRGAGMK
jgi:hypothetical protein